MIRKYGMVAVYLLAIIFILTSCPKKEVARISETIAPEPLPDIDDEGISRSDLSDTALPSIDTGVQAENQ